MAISIFPTVSGNSCSLLNAIIGNCPVGTLAPNNPPAPAAPQDANSMLNWTTAKLDAADFVNWLGYKSTALDPAVSADTGLDQVLYKSGAVGSDIGSQSMNLLTTADNLLSTTNPLGTANFLVLAGLGIVGVILLGKVLA